MFSLYYAYTVTLLFKFNCRCFPLGLRERGVLVANASDFGSRGPRVQAPLGSNPVVSLRKAHLLPKSTGNAQEAVGPSQHYRKIVYRDNKNQSTNHRGFKGRILVLIEPLTLNFSTYLNKLFFPISSKHLAHT